MKFMVVFWIFCHVLFQTATLEAGFSAADVKTKQRLEKEVKELHSQLKELEKKLGKEDNTEWKAFLKDAKGTGATRAQKINVAKDHYEISEANKKLKEEYRALKEKYKNAKTKLDQLEWESKEGHHK